MKNLKTVISFMVLTMLIAVLPAVNAAVEAEQVAAPYEFIAYVQNISAAANPTGYVEFDLNSSTHPSILYYDFDEGEGNESLFFNITISSLDITGTDSFVYQTSVYDKDGENFIAWLGKPYFVVEAGGDWYLSELLIDEDKDDSNLLEVGETLTLEEGIALTPVEIDVDGGEAWFTVTKDGEEVKSLVVNEGDLFQYKEDLNDSGTKDNWVLKFNVETVFAGMNTNLVKINETQLISTDITLVETPDDDLFSDFEINDIGTTTLTIKFDTSSDEISLKKDTTVGFLDDRFNFKINEDGNIGGLVVVKTEPGIYELFGEVQNITTAYNGAYVEFDLNSTINPSILYYDFDEGEGNESLFFNITTSSLDITGTDSFLYQSTVYDKDGENFIAWLGKPYFVVEAGGDWYLSELLIDEDKDDSNLLEVGETLTLEEGIALTPVEIDVDGGEAWFTVTKDGEEVKSLVVDEGDLFQYKEDLNDSGSKDNWVLKFNVETVFAGMNTNLVKINETQLISTDITLVETPDDDLFSDFEINDIGTTTLTIKLDTSSDEISLKKDTTVSFLDDRFSFKINEDGNIGGICKIIEIGGVPSDTVDDDVTVDADATVDANATVDADATVAVVDTDVTPVDTDEVPPVEATTEQEPGFEAVFAIAGLLAVAYLVLRKRE